jgi:phosphohistidine phosphatase
MTILTVLRHAKSSWDEPEVNDFDRPLNERGRRAAKAVGRELERRHVRFDRVFASPALRVRQTIDLLAEGLGGELDVTFDEAIYENEADALFHFVRSIPETVHAPLLVGHNPGLQRLVLKLTCEDDRGFHDRVRDKFPTAAVAVLKLPAERWAEVEPASGEIAELILPKELD